MIEQGALPGLGAARRPRRLREPEPARVAPVAAVTLDLGTPHLDRTFDYMVPASLDASAVPGARVRVAFGGRSVTGFIVERRDQSDHPGALSPLARVQSGLPLLTPGLWRLAQAVAERQAGVVADVLRLAIPPAHIETEKRLAEESRQAQPPASGAVPQAPAHGFGPTPSTSDAVPQQPGSPLLPARGLGRPSSLDPFLPRLRDWWAARGSGTPVPSGAAGPAHQRQGGQRPPRVVW
ncbi:MAG: hypothetical protein LBD97_10550, partial [Bifidobacteriaceae bacterium]|nr:hypothetical protein [Bifidobacteriaceae bacterium]